MTLEDDRTEDELTTNCYLLGGLDPGMSGWGGAARGNSYAYWACTADDVPAVERWVNDRDDLRRVTFYRTVGSKRFRKFGANDHAHIYVVRPGHPAITGR